MMKLIHKEFLKFFKISVFVAVIFEIIDLRPKVESLIIRVLALEEFSHKIKILCEIFSFQVKQKKGQNVKPTRKTRKSRKLKET